MTHRDTEIYSRCKTSHQPPVTPCFFRKSCQGCAFKNSLPFCMSSLHSLLLFLFLCSCNNGSFHLFYFFILNFPSSSFKCISSIFFPHPCHHRPFLHATNIFHHPSCLPSSLVLLTACPSVGSSPGFLSLLSLTIQQHGTIQQQGTATCREKL